MASLALDGVGKARRPALLEGARDRVLDHDHVLRIEETVAIKVAFEKHGQGGRERSQGSDHEEQEPAVLVGRGQTDPGQRAPLDGPGRRQRIIRHGRHQLPALIVIAMAEDQ